MNARGSQTECRVHPLGYRLARASLNSSSLWFELGGELAVSLSDLLRLVETTGGCE